VLVNKSLRVRILQLSDVDKQALCLGLDFRISPKRSEQLHINAEFENLYQQLYDVPVNSGDSSLLKAELVTTASSFGRSKIDNGPSCFLPCHKTALLKLRRNPDVMILRPDKGSGVVVMDRSDYVRKVRDILCDASKFKIDDRQVDASAKTSKEFACVLTVLKSRRFITEAERRSLSCTNVASPRLYALPKTHKPNVPVRPILSMTQTAYERVSKWLAEMLKPVEESFTGFCVKDSFSFVENIQDFDASSVSMVSFDVSSLFTNVPVHETVDIITNAVSENPDLCPLPPELLRELLLLCVSNVQFLFDGHFYRQIDGVAMGSPLGPLFANIFMGSIERKLKDDIEASCSKFYRYVDDTFAFVRNGHCFQRLLDLFNSAHSNLSFTHECESNGSLSFLDVSVHRRSDGTLSTKTYRKPTFSGVYLNFHSFVPMSYKSGLVRTLSYRALRICSPEFIDAELRAISNILKMNSYPQTFIDKHKTTSIQTKVPVDTVGKKAVFLTVPFYGDAAAIQLKKKLNNIFDRFVPAAKPVILHKTCKIPVASPKDPLPEPLTPSVIYSFKCSCGAAYIGRTSRSLAVRSREHVPKWLLEGRTGQAKSAITEHLQTCNFDPSCVFKSFSVVCRCRHDRLMRILEALFIKRDKPLLCRQKDHVIDLRLPW
jgi:hypothetical protein